MHRLSLFLTLVLVAMVGSSAAGCAPVYASPRYEVVAVGSPGPGWVWEPGHWVRHRHGDLWIRGHWRRY